MSPCVNWTGPFGSLGYGRFKRAGKLILAHRQAFFATHGYWPKVCRHTCDNRACVNPEHLLDGTRGDNNRDRTARGRSAKGAAHGLSKLTEDAVINIRERWANGERQVDLAAEYGVYQTTISSVVRRKVWTHV